MIEPTAQVYRCFDASDQLLYVGLSYGPEGRLKAHYHSSPWFADVARVTVTERMPRKVAAQVEREAIRTERPVHNKQRTYVVLPPIEAAS